MSFVAKQPNGLYCRFSTVVDAPTHYDMTFNDYVEIIMSRGYDLKHANLEAKDIIENHLKPFERVVESFIPYNMSKDDFKEWLKIVGYEESN